MIIRDLWSLRLQKLAPRVDLDEDDEEGDPQSQVYSSTAESETENEEGEVKVTNRRKLSDTPSLIEALALCYFGILILRLPVSAGEVQRWAASGSLLYYRAVTVLPEAMRDPLGSYYLEMLEPRSVLRSGDLQTTVYNLSGAYRREYQLQFPPVNLHLLLFRYIKDLALPLETYPCVRSLISLSKSNFEYSTQFIGPYPPVSTVPDAQIISHIFVAAKLLYPISNPRFHPTTPNELASLVLNWQKWLSAKRTHDAKFSSSGRLNYADAWAGNDADVFTWEQSQMDDYLTWYERTWTKSEPPANDDFRKALFDLFPTGTNEMPPTAPEGLDEDLSPNTYTLEASRRERVRAVIGSLRRRKAVSDEDARRRAEKGKPTPRPGVVYERFKNVKDLDGPDGGDGVARALYEQGAEMVELPLEVVVAAVYRVEERLNKWIKAEERKEKLELQERQIMSADEDGSDDHDVDEEMETV